MRPEYMLKWWDTDNVEHRDLFVTFRERLVFINENEDRIVAGELYNMRKDGDYFYYRKFKGNAAQKVEPLKKQYNFPVPEWFE